MSKPACFYKLGFRGWWPCLYLPLFRNDTVHVQPQVDHLVVESGEPLQAFVVRGAVTRLSSASGEVPFNKCLISGAEGVSESCS